MPPSVRANIARARADVEAGIARALGVAASRASRYLLTRATLRDIVTTVDPRTDTYERALTVVERRTLRVEIAPGLGTRPEELAPMPEPAGKDPWRVDRAALARDQVVCACPACNGERVLPCKRCEGGGRIRCEVCAGAGKLDGRPCSRCERTGEAPCPSCNRGQVDCATCERIGRVRAWLHLETRTIFHVEVAGDPTGIAAHEGVRSPADFDAGSSRWKNELFHDSGVVPSSAGVPDELLPPLDPATDRVRSVRVQSFASSVYRLTYVTPLGGGTLEVAGNPPELVASASFAPLRLRRAVILAFLVMGVWVSLMARHGYESRHAWFRDHGDGTLLLAFCLGATVFATATAAGMLLPLRAWRSRRTLLPVILALACVGGATWASRLHVPTVVSARASLARGDVAGATAEAEAVLALGPSPDATRLLDDAGVRQVEVAPDLPTAIERASRTFETRTAKDAAADIVRRRADAQLASAVAAADARAVFAVGDALKPFDVAAAVRAFDAGAELEVARCARDGILPCDFRGGELPDPRREALERTLERAYAERSLARGDWEGLAARLGRWTTRSGLADDTALLRLAAATRILGDLGVLARREPTLPEPAQRLELVEQQMALSRSYQLFADKEPPPGIAVLAQRREALSREVIRREQAKRPRPAWR